MNEIINKINFLLDQKSFKEASYLLETVLIMNPKGGAHLNILLAEVYIILKENYYRFRARQLLEAYLDNELNPDPKAVKLLIFNVYLTNGPVDKASEYSQKFKSQLSEEEFNLINKKLSEVNELEISLNQQSNSKVPIGRFPDQIDEFQNLQKLIEVQCLNGSPDLKILNNSKIFTFGSCFARNVGRVLKDKYFNVNDFFIGEEVNTTFSNLNIIKYILFNNLENHKDYYQNLLQHINVDKIRQQFKESEIFIYTAGVASAFFNKKNKSYIPHSPANFKKIINNKDYEHRYSTVDENILNLEETLKLLREECNFKHLFVTISPIPLSASIGNNSAVIADMESKSILRNAVGIFSRSNTLDVTYFPSFEVFRFLPCFRNESAFGLDDGSSRHPNYNYISTVIDLFIKKYS
jgi:hypothetical protein